MTYRAAVVLADNYGNGVAAAHLMAKALGPDGGEIVLVFHAADFFVTKQRYDAFKATIASDDPHIIIVDEQGIGGPDFSDDAEKAAGAMLTSNPGIKGIWAVWDVPDLVALPALPVAQDNLLEAWVQVYSTEAAENVKSSMQ